MKHKLLLPVFVAICSIAMAQQSDPKKPGAVRTNNEPLRNEKELKKVLSQVETDPEFQKQRELFQAAVQAANADPDLQSQREKMNQDVRALEASPEIQLQKARLRKDLQLAEKDQYTIEQRKKSQDDAYRSRQGAQIKPK